MMQGMDKTIAALLEALSFSPHNIRLRKHVAELLVQAGEAQFVLLTHGRPVVNPGDKIGLSVDPRMVHVFDQKTGARLAA